MKKFLSGILLGLVLHLSPIQANAYTLTPNYSFYLPGVNDPADANNWGTYLNDNFSSIDSLLPGLSGTNTFTGLNTFSLVTTFNGDIKVTNSINDSSNNEEIVFGVTASAVNEITVTNAATGTNPIISSSGGDTNIGLNFLTKGTGVYRFLATASGPAEIRFLEDSDNGTNYTGLKAASSITTDTVFELPAADGTSGQFIKTNGSGVLSFGTATSILQIVQTSNATYTSGAGTIPLDNTIPQNTEGQEFTQVATAVTPIAGTSTLIIDYQAYITNSGTDYISLCLFIDSTANALDCVNGRSITSTQGIWLKGSFLVSSGSTSARTYKLRYGAPSGTSYINGGNAAGFLGGVMPTVLRVTEIAN